MGNSKVFYILQTKAYPTQNVQKHAIASSRASRRPIRSLAFWRAFLAANGRTPRRWAYRPDGRPMGRRDLSAFACCPFLVVLFLGSVVCRINTQWVGSVSCCPSALQSLGLRLHFLECTCMKGWGHTVSAGMRCACMGHVWSGLNGERHAWDA